jgi:hypothetical protein
MGGLVVLSSTSTNHLGSSGEAGECCPAGVCSIGGPWQHSEHAHPHGYHRCAARPGNNLAPAAAHTMPCLQLRRPSTAGASRTAAVVNGDPRLPYRPSAKWSVTQIKIHRQRSQLSQACTTVGRRSNSVHILAAARPRAANLRTGHGTGGRGFEGVVRSALSIAFVWVKIPLR